MMLERLKQSLESGQPYEAQCRLRRADGVYRWFAGSAVPVRAQDGAVVRWLSLANTWAPMSPVDFPVDSTGGFTHVDGADAASPIRRIDLPWARSHRAGKPRA